jgi:hypothetical protein
MTHDTTCGISLRLAVLHDLFEHLRARLADQFDAFMAFDASRSTRLGKPLQQVIATDQTGQCQGEQGDKASISAAQPSHDSLPSRTREGEMFASNIAPRLQQPVPHAGA